MGKIVLCDLEGNNVISYSRVYLFNILTILVYSKDSQGKIISYCTQEHF